MATEELLPEVRALIAERQKRGILGLADRLGPAEWADLMPRLDPGEVAVLFQWLPDAELAELLEELDPAAAAAILRPLSRPAAADLLEAMDPDDATDVIEELPDAEAELILTAMEPEEAAEIRELMAYPPDCAGGIMTPAFVAVTPLLRADEAVASLRRVAEEAETLFYVYVIDREERLLGVLSLHNLVLTRPETPVERVMIPDPIRVRVDADQETAARLLVDHNLLALPSSTRRTTCSGSSPRTTSRISWRRRRPRTSSGSAARSRSTPRTVWRGSGCCSGGGSAGCSSSSLPAS